MGKTKRERGLCSVVGCHEKAVVRWITGGDTQLFVCAKHDEEAREQMGTVYQRLHPLELCPECGEPLETIVPIHDGVAYRWNGEDKYIVDDAQENVNFAHNECRKLIGGWRADGEQWGFVPLTE